MKKKYERMIPQKAVNEMMDICVAWIGLLFRRLGVGEYRVTMDELKEGLGKYQFSAFREGDTYTIRLSEPTPQEDSHDGDEQ